MKYLFILTKSNFFVVEPSLILNIKVKKVVIKVINSQFILQRICKKWVMNIHYNSNHRWVSFYFSELSEKKKNTKKQKNQVYY